MNTRAPHPSRITLVTAIGLSAILASSAYGAAPADVDYQRIVPRQPNPEHSASAIAALCAEVASATIRNCPAADQARTFCAAPLKMEVPRPKTSDLDAIAKGRCPEAAEARSTAFTGGTRGAGLFGLPWQDALIRGLAGFLVERAKAEALAAAADRFRTGLCADATAKRLLPLTCALLDTSAPHVVPASWAALKSAAETDLHDLPLHVLDLKIRRRTDALKDAPELLYAAVDISERTIAEQKDPLPLLVGLQDQYGSAAPDCSNRPTACALLGTGIVSEVVLSGYQPETAPTSFAAIALRVILDQAMAKGLLAAGDAQSVLTPWQKQLGTVLAAVDRAIEKGKAAKVSKKPEDIGAYVTSLNDIVTTTLDLFASTVPSTREVLAPIERALGGWPPLVEAALSKNYVTAAVHLVALLQPMDGGAAPEWTRYLLLVAELAQAQTGDEVKSTIESISAPVGSYLSKRGDGNRRLTINGYVGFQGGREWLGGGGVPKASSLQGGVFAPVGLESSWGFGKSSSVGVLLSVIDLGAVMSFRTASESASQGTGAEMVTVNQEPQIGLSQVFAPGLYLLYGIPCTPLVLGAGASLAPELRKVTFVGSGMSESVTALRAGLFLAIDVTIFPF